MYKIFSISIVVVVISLILFVLVVEDNEGVDKSPPVLEQYELFPHHSQGHDWLIPELYYGGSSTLKGSIIHDPDCKSHGVNNLTNIKYDYQLKTGDKLISVFEPMIKYEGCAYYDLIIEESSGRKINVSAHSITCDATNHNK